MSKEKKKHAGAQTEQSGSEFAYGVQTSKDKKRQRRAMMTMDMQAQETISLPQPEVSKLSMTLGNALQQRRSERKFSDKEISIQTLSTLLWAACGVSDPKSGKITAPSAVNMQDVKVYVCSKSGVCLYNAKANTLT
jgi:hypothetical protein